MKFLSAVFFAVLVFSLCAGEYKIVPKGPSFQIFRNGKLLVNKVESPLTSKSRYSYKVEKKVLKDGSQVWNFISTDKRLNYRMEAALLDKGRCVEITAAAARPALSKEKTAGPLMAFELPREFFQGAQYEGLENVTHSWSKKTGVLTLPAKFPRGKYWRWMGLKNKEASVIFDFNPFGPGYGLVNTWYGVCRGVALLSQRNDAFRMNWPFTLWSSFGGYLSAKLRIKDGTIADYSKDHALKRFQYVRPIERQHLFSFGSLKHGNYYTSANGKKYDSVLKWGWISGRPAKTVTTGSGAYYSHQAGKNSTFRISGLTDGLHLVTFGAGNPTGTANRFSVTVNGQKLLNNVTIAKDRFLTATLPIWIDKGGCDVKLTGDYIVSAIGNQFLLSNREDFTCRRGFWVSDSYEPSALHNNANSKPFAHTFKASVQETVLPRHGQEMAAPYRKFKAKITPWDLKSPKYSWLFNTNIAKVGNNYATFEEMEDPKVMEAVLDGELKKGKNTIMLSGLLSRHTFPKSRERVLKLTERFNKMARKKGFKVINHYDVTLLWNAEAGFRVLAETLHGVNRSLSTQLPGAQYCILSSHFKKQTLDYVRDLAKAGTDGFQLDEYCFVGHSCGCSACREAFHRDTGWYIPVDETHPGYRSHKHPMYRAILDWKIEKGQESRILLRQEISEAYPDLAFTSYGAFSLTQSPGGLRWWMSDMMRTGRNFCLMGKESQCGNVISNARMFIASQKFYNFFRYCFGIPIYTWCGTWDWKNSYFAFFTCIMNGQSPLDFGGGFNDKSPGHMVFEPFAAHPDAMDRQLCREMAKVGVLYSYRTVCEDFKVLTPPGVYGFTQTAEELHIPHVYLSDDALDEKFLKDLKLLYVGSASCLTDEQIAHIKKFVKKGGTVMMNTVAGTRNENGDLRRQWPFEKIMGFKPSARMNEVQSFSMDRITAAPAEKKLKSVELIPAQKSDKNSFTVKLKNGKILPGVIEKSYGKGKFLYFPCRMEELFYFPIVTDKQVNKVGYDAPMASFYRSLLRKKIGNASLLQTNAPEKVFMTLYREKDQVLVHLLNGSASGMKKGEKGAAKFKGDPFPALKKDISITVPCFGKNGAFAVSPDFKGRRSLTVKYNSNKTATVILPGKLLKGYTLIRIH